MENFIKEQNIRLLRAKLAETPDPAEREVLLRLLAEQEGKTVPPGQSRTPRSNSARGERSGRDE